MILIFDLETLARPGVRFTKESGYSLYVWMVLCTIVVHMFHTRTRDNMVIVTYVSMLPILLHRCLVLLASQSWAELCICLRTECTVVKSSEFCQKFSLRSF